MSIGFTMNQIRENYLSKVKRVIIKIGSKELSNGKTKISRRVIQNLHTYIPVSNTNLRAN